METSQSHFEVKTYAIIILAAGNSSRLGQPKQLLTFEHKSLLENTIESAKKTKAEKVIVVLGANKETIATSIGNEDILLVENLDWESGMSSSIHAGINALTNILPEIDGAILMVCDQPFASTEILDDIIVKQLESGQAIVGSTYEDTKGTPAFFHQTVFPELLALTGDNGAKILFEKYKTAATFVSFQKGGIDIDTPEDYNKLVK